MTDTYADTTALTARLSDAYAVPVNAAQLLMKASELIDYATLGRAQIAYDSGTTAQKDLLSDATCDQVEFWLEVGEEHDVAGIRGSLQGGRVQVQHMPGVLSQRSLRALIRAGLFWAGADAI